MSKAEALADLIKAIRSSFNRLKMLGDNLHSDLGITTAQRGVMEFLFEGGATTVPHMAKAKGVSRQHIQLLMDSLEADHLVVGIANPAHKRSPMYELSDKGRKQFLKLTGQELPIINAIAKRLDADELEKANSVLAILVTQLDASIEKKN